VREFGELEMAIMDVMWATEGRASCVRFGNGGDQVADTGSHCTDHRSYQPSHR
jgi:hypothetical protein